MGRKFKDYNPYCLVCNCDTNCMPNPVRSYKYKGKFCDIYCWREYEKNNEGINVDVVLTNYDRSSAECVGQPTDYLLDR